MIFTVVHRESGSRTTYCEELVTVGMIVHDPKRELENIDDRIEVIFFSGDFYAVKVPRYQPFTEIILKLAKSHVRIDEACLLPKDIQIAYPELLASGFQGMSYDRQTNLLMDLRRHSENDIRRAVFALRKTYVSLAYASKLPNGKSLAELISGIDEKSVVTKEVDYHLPESKLLLNDGVISHRDGDIDYLIIGSGPAGSLIASELARLGAA